MDATIIVAPEQNDHAAPSGAHSHLFGPRFTKGENSSMSSWGRNVEQKSVGTYGIKILHPRPLHLACILTEAQKWGEREFIVFDRRRISFRQFLSASGHAAERLRAAGIAPGDVVVLEGANSPEWMLVFWGLVRIGAVVAQGNA